MKRGKQMGTTLKGNAHAAVARFDSAMHLAHRKAEDFSSEALRLASKHPVKTIAVGVAAGFLAGALIGRHRRALAIASPRE